jgi:hypothetical protein
VPFAITLFSDHLIGTRPGSDKINAIIRERNTALAAQVARQRTIIGLILISLREIAAEHDCPFPIENLPLLSSLYIGGGKNQEGK